MNYSEAMQRVKTELLPIVRERKAKGSSRYIGGPDGGRKIIRGAERIWVGYWYTKGTGSTTYDVMLGYGDTWEKAIEAAAAKLAKATQA